MAQAEPCLLVLHGNCTGILVSDLLGDTKLIRPREHYKYFLGCSIT